MFLLFGATSGGKLSVAYSKIDKELRGEGYRIGDKAYKSGVEASFSFISLSLQVEGEREGNGVEGVLHIERLGEKSVKDLENVGIGFARRGKGG